MENTTPQKDGPASADNSQKIMDVQPPVGTTEPTKPPLQQAPAQEPSGEPKLQDQPTEHGPKPSETPEPAPDEQDQPATPPPPPGSTSSHRGPIIAIVVAIIVMFGLIGVAVYAYTTQTEGGVGTTNETACCDNPAEQQTESQPATADDIEALTKDVNQSLSELDQTEELDNSSLSDENLGL